MSGTPTSPPEDGIESSFCKAAMARSGSPMRAATRARIRSDGTSQGVFLDWIRGHGPFRQSQSGGLVTETHIGQREIANEDIIVRLFFKERFQLVTRLPPSLGQRQDRRRLPAPNLTKSAAPHRTLLGSGHE